MPLLLQSLSLVIGAEHLERRDGEWIDPDGRRQKLADPDAVMLGSDALWTTFWNLNQVMDLLAPEWAARWVKSELQLYDKCGWLAKGPAG